jgi:hypothetical protein
MKRVALLTVLLGIVAAPTAVLAWDLSLVPYYNQYGYDYRSDPSAAYRAYRLNDPNELGDYQWLLDNAYRKGVWVYPSDPGGTSHQYNATDYQDMWNGKWHCFPTSSAMVMAYWDNYFDNLVTMAASTYAVDLISSMSWNVDCNDENLSIGAGDNKIHYGTYSWSDGYEGIKNYIVGQGMANYFEVHRYNKNYKVIVENEIYWDRPLVVWDSGHAQTVVGYDANGVKTHNPWGGGDGYVRYDKIYGIITLRPIPEPSTLILFAGGAVGLLVFARRRFHG